MQNYNRLEHEIQVVRCGETYGTMELTNGQTVGFGRVVIGALMRDEAPAAHALEGYTHARAWDRIASAIARDAGDAFAAGDAELDGLLRTVCVIAREIEARYRDTARRCE